MKHQIVRSAEAIQNSEEVERRMYDYVLAIDRIQRLLATTQIGRSTTFNTSML